MSPNVLSRKYWKEHLPADAPPKLLDATTRAINFADRIRTTGAFDSPAKAEAVALLAELKEVIALGEAQRKKAADDLSADA